jgi:hypothetical protein
MVQPMNQFARLVGVIGLLVGLVACASSGTPSAATSPGGSASASALASDQSVEPSASTEGSETGSPDPDTAPIFQNWGLATVRVNGLNVRAEQSTQAPVLDDTYGLYGAGGKVRLAAGDHVFVISSAEWADGRWWLMIATDRVDLPGTVQVGYVAAGTRADPWVAGDNAWCPGEGPSLSALLRLSGIERVGCYSSARLSFRAYRATEPPDGGLGGACESAPTVPRWLVCDNINYNWVNRDGGDEWELLLHFDPATGIAPTGLAKEGSPNPRMTVKGHFDDAAAQRCAPDPPTTLEETAAYWTCATLFVVEKIN